MRESIASRCLVNACAAGTDGLQLVRRRCGIGAELRDRDQADAWASQQAWHGRVVRKARARGWWCWWVRPEERR